MAHDRIRRNHDLASLRVEKGDTFGQKRQLESRDHRAFVADKSKSEQTFQAGITTTFTTMREDLERMAKETKAYADEILDILGQLEESHLRKHATFQFIKEHPSMNKEKFGSLFLTYSSLLDELVPLRMQMIRAGGEATEAQLVQMRKSRKDVMNAAKQCLDEGREKQQLAADASELMRYYKALILAV